MSHHLSESRTVPVAPEEAFARTMPMPLDTLFVSRSGPIPPVSGTREQPATWDTVGQCRTIVLADGGTMRETLTTVDAPRSFGYDITHLTGMFTLVVSSVAGLWTFEPDGAGCRITWSWTIEPRRPIGPLAMPAFGRFWHPYARTSLARLEANLTRT